MDYSKELLRLHSRQIEYLGLEKPINIINPLVSVWVITYQHRNFITDCLAGILMQKTNFPIEIVIGDDESSDGTREFCKQYAENNPDKIRLFLRERNQSVVTLNGKTLYFNGRLTTMSCRGKYIAFCEGDDYWTDPYKLQKQVDFLENNQSFAICFHNANVFNNKENTFVFQQPGINEDKIYTINDYLKNNPCPTAAVLFKSEYINSLPEWFSKTPFGDYTLYLYILSKSGKNAYYFKDTMSVYRIHSGGVHGNAHLSNAGMIKAYKQHLVFWSVIKKYLFVNQYHTEINETVASDYNLLINYLIKDNHRIEALKYNTLYMFHSRFKFLKQNIRTYLTIVKLLVKL
ncbi:MAG: glycosyltransferase [Bacteroidales bacterium]